MSLAASQDFLFHVPHVPHFPVLKFVLGWCVFHYVPLLRSGVRSEASILGRCLVRCETAWSAFCRGLTRVEFCQMWKHLSVLHCFYIFSININYKYIIACLKSELVFLVQCCVIDFPNAKCGPRKSELESPKFIRALQTLFDLTTRQARMSGSGMSLQFMNTVSIRQSLFNHCSIAFNMTCQFLLTFCGTSVFAVNKTNAMQRYAKCTCNAGRPGGSMFNWIQCQVITRDRQGKLPFGTQTRLAGLNRAWIPNARETDMKKKPIAYIVHFLHKLIN